MLKFKGQGHFFWDFVLVLKMLKISIITDMSLVSFTLKSISYVLSIAGGVFVFDISEDYLHDPSWIDLMNNVAASLLAIPLVFLFYDYSNFLITRRMHNHQHIAVISVLDGYLLKILSEMKNIIGLKHT